MVVVQNYNIFRVNKMANKVFTFLPASNQPLKINDIPFWAMYGLYLQALAPTRYI
jgi:hypothetical protein